MSNDKQRLLRQLSNRLNYTFKNEALLIEALSHRSIGALNYERLEFLGDSALNFVISTALFQSYANLDEGSLSRLRASLVNGKTLSEIARELDLGPHLLLGSGELKSGGFDRDSILADVIESLIGAVYLDSDVATCEQFILRLFQHRIDTLPPVNELKDAKTQLQEFLQGKGFALPHYDLIETSGKSHERRFTVSCKVDSHGLKSIAEGTSRRKSEQIAARDMLDKLLELESQS